MARAAQAKRVMAARAAAGRLHGRALRLDVTAPPPHARLCVVRHARSVHTLLPEGREYRRLVSVSGLVTCSRPSVRPQQSHKSHKSHDFEGHVITKWLRGHTLHVITGLRLSVAAAGPSPHATCTSACEKVLTRHAERARDTLPTRPPHGTLTQFAQG